MVTIQFGMHGMKHEYFSDPISRMYGNDGAMREAIAILDPFQKGSTIVPFRRARGGGLLLNYRPLSVNQRSLAL